MAIESKRKLFATELQRYFGETCPALVARWEAAIVGLAPPALRELAGRLQALEIVTDETNWELSAAQVAATEGQASTELLLDRALASMEHLNEVAQAMTRRLEELLNA